MALWGAIDTGIGIVADNKLNAFMLTTPQEAALAHFADGTWRRIFPDVNPRTATALRALSLLEWEQSQGRNLYRLTLRGRQMLDLLEGRNA